MSDFSFGANDPIVGFGPLPINAGSDSPQIDPASGSSATGGGPGVSAASSTGTSAGGGVFGWLGGEGHAFGQGVARGLASSIASTEMGVGEWQQAQGEREQPYVDQARMIAQMPDGPDRQTQSQAWRGRVAQLYPPGTASYASLQAWFSDLLRDPDGAAASPSPSAYAPAGIQDNPLFRDGLRRRADAAAAHPADPNYPMGGGFGERVGGAVGGAAAAFPVVGAGISSFQARGDVAADAVAHGATPDQRRRAAELAAAVGLASGGLQRFLPGGLAAGSLAGGSVGGIHQLLVNAIARETYDPQRPLWDGVPAAAAGAAGMQAGGGAIVRAVQAAAGRLASSATRGAPGGDGAATPWSGSRPSGGGPSAPSPGSGPSPPAPSSPAASSPTFEVAPHPDGSDSVTVRVAGGPSLPPPPALEVVPHPDGEGQTVRVVGGAGSSPVAESSRYPQRGSDGLALLGDDGFVRSTGAGAIRFPSLYEGQAWVDGENKIDASRRLIVVQHPDGGGFSVRPAAKVNGVYMEGPVDFGIPDWATPDQLAQIQTYVDGANQAVLDGTLSATGRVSTEGELRSDANRAATAERTRALQAGTPYQGQVGHVPDVTWTGRPDGLRYMDIDRRVNGRLGWEATRYPIGYKPTIFRLKAPGI